jgi:hypothetical protein
VHGARHGRVAQVVGIRLSNFTSIDCAVQSAHLCRQLRIERMRPMRSEPAGLAAALLCYLGLGPRITPSLPRFGAVFSFLARFRFAFPASKAARVRHRRRRLAFPASTKVRRRQLAAACVVSSGTCSQVCAPLHVCSDCINILLICLPSSTTSSRDVID